MKKSISILLSLLLLLTAMLPASAASVLMATETTLEAEETTLEGGETAEEPEEEKDAAVYDEALVSESIRSYIEEVEAKVIAGEIEVSSAFSMSTEEVVALRDSMN